MTLSERGDINCPVPMMAVVGEPLEAMVSNLGQDDDSFTSFGSSTRRVASQGFRTGSADHGYRLQGIGVNIDGSDDSNGTPQLPGGPSSVSVSVHEDVNGSPGAKLFDLISPDEYAPGVSFFEAPPDTALLPDTSYVMVWRYLSGAWHRLVRTASDDEDAGGLTDFRIADAFRSGADLTSLSEDTDGYGLELAVYGEAYAGRAIAPDAVQVTSRWPHLPEGLEVGDQFRLIFITSLTTDATSDDIEHYNAVARRDAAQPYNDRIIRGHAGEFKALACTAEVDARANTGMTDYWGVPVHWLDGGWQNHSTLIARTNAQLFGGDWVNREHGAYSLGNSTELYPSRQLWTGCDASGAAHPTIHLGNTSDMGMAATGTPGRDGPLFFPLGSTNASDDYVSAEKDTFLPIYAISPVFIVVDQR